MVALQLFAFAQSRIPNAHLEVTIRQEENGQIEKGYHVLDLLCWNGQCSLTTLSLNQCHPGSSGKQVFYPKVVTTSTREGNLKLTRQGNVLVVQETGSDVGGDYVTTHRIGFELPSVGGIVSRVTSYSGGFVKDSQILKKVITLNYVALKKLFQEVDRVTGSDPSVTDYVLEQPAKCPNCQREILEKTLVEPE
jgi:hypothetical protein